MLNRALSLLFFTLALHNLASAEAQVIVLSCKTQLPKDYFDDYQLKQCIQSKLTYSHKREFIFDKKSLNDKKESWAEVIMQTCWGVDERFRNKINATPTVISFITENLSFNVDRATLKGGWSEHEANWQCDLKEKILKNKI